jgi:4-amino-4-deoxy-L-arabinose transferase-like glycosyltransferase
VVLVTLLAALLRLPWLGHLNFRNDESFSLLYARQSWAGVLGFDGFYDFHPPLMFALGKLANLFVPETLASRTVSVIFGLATVPVLYALARRLLDARAAFVASLIFTLAPAHVEFSRVGRMYAPVTFAVALSYLALVAYLQDPRKRWAALYGFALVLAIYLDYSSLYGLIPQLALVIAVALNLGRKSIWIFAAALGAFIAYLPWATQLPGTVRLANEYSRRATYLAASWRNIETAIPGLLGLQGGGAGSNADFPNLWARWSDLHMIWLIALVPLIVASVLALRHFPLAALVTLGLLIGTPLVAIGASQVSPGFALRTILPATLGWSLLGGAAFAGVRMPGAVRVAALASCAFLVLASAIALPATYSDKNRVLRVDRASDTIADVAPMEKPVLTFSTGGLDTDLIDAFVGDRIRDTRIITFVDGRLETASAMSRWESRGPTRLQVKHGELPTYFNPADPANDSFWFFTHRSATDFDNAFRELGYDQRLSLNYNRAYVEFWALPGARIGEPIEMADSATDPGGVNWVVSDGVEIASISGSLALTLPVSGTPPSARRSFGGISAGLYSLDVDVEQEANGGATVTLQCQSADGGTLASYSEPQAGDDNATPEEHGGTIRLSVLCPTGTVGLFVKFHSTGDSVVRLREPRLYAFPLPSVTWFK